MYVAVKFYQDVTDKPTGIPDNWPAEVRELGDSSDLPEDLSASIWHVMSYEDLQDYRAQNQSIFDAWYSHYTAPTPQQIVQGKIINAKAFGENLLNEIATDNVLLGATTEQIESLIINNLGLILMLKSGSLYTALATLTNFSPNALITQARLDKYTGQLKAYLGIS